MAAEEIIRKYTTPAYRAPEVLAQHYCTVYHALLYCVLALDLLIMCGLTCNTPLHVSLTWFLLQMYDLYMRERIDTKADIWVRTDAASVALVQYHVNMVMLLLKAG